MTTFNTGNPIGSTDARDRLDNSENMDILENSTTLNAHADRLGTMRKTRKGMELEHDNQMQSFENDFDSRLAGMAFTRVGTFTAGATLTDMRQTLLWELSQGGDGREYGWTGSFLPSGKIVPPGSTPATTGGIGAGAWVDRTDDTLRSDLNTSVNQRSVEPKNIFDVVSDITSRRIIYAEEFGVVNSSTADSADALQAIITAYPNHTIVLPDNFALSHSIKYPSACDITGRARENCACYMLPGFISTYGAAFEPLSTVSKAVTYANISNIIFVDSSAAEDGAGSTSILNGVELLGTYVTRCTNLKGVRINAIVHAGEGASGVHQYTMRPILKGFDGDHINYTFKFDHTSENRFPYGDIFCSEMYTSGAVKYGGYAEDTDGFTWTGSTMFPNAQLRVSGNYISVAVCHPFEAKVKLTDTPTAECFIIAERFGGGISEHANISVVSAVSGRLTDDYVSTTQVNKAANGISLHKVEDFVLSAAINDPSMTGLYLTQCNDGVINVSIRSANTQDVGAIKLPVGTYDSVLLAGCRNIIGRLSDKSAAKRYAVYMDDSCFGCHFDVVTTKGTLPTPSNVRIPPNGNNSYTSLSETSTGGYKKYTSHEGQHLAIGESSGATKPSCSYGRSGAIISFDNSISTLVTDIPDVGAYDEVTLHINDNGATKLVSVANGGKFLWSDGTTATKLGRGLIVKVMRSPATGYLVQV